MVVSLSPKAIRVLVSILALLLVLVPATLAQDAPDTIELVGIVQAIDANTLTVSQQAVDISNAEINAPLELNSLVKVEGSLLGDGSIVAREVNPTIGDITLIPSEFEIVGPLKQVGGSFIVVSGQTISVVGAEINSPLVIGDLVKVHLTNVNGQLTAREVEEALDEDDVEDVNIRIEGQVEAIDDGVVTINGIDIVLPVDPPLLSTLQLNDFIELEGRFRFEIQDGKFRLRVQDENEAGDEFRLEIRDEDEGFRFEIRREEGDNSGPGGGGAVDDGSGSNSGPGGGDDDASGADRDNSGSDDGSGSDSGNSGSGSGNSGSGGGD